MNSKAIAHAKQQIMVPMKAHTVEQIQGIPIDLSGCSTYDTPRFANAASTERDRLDCLVGQALIDPTICRRLLEDHDSSLFPTFGLSEQTQDWLSSTNVSTLQELAQAIVAATNSAALTVATKAKARS